MVVFQSFWYLSFVFNQTTVRYRGRFPGCISGHSTIPFMFLATNCGKFMRGPSNTVKSSNFPSNYNDNEYCTWQIQVPVDKKIRLDFTDFKTETGKDFLMIYDTSHYHAPTIVFDGTTYKPPPFTSSGNVVRVRFVSDGATNLKGFSFNYKQVGKKRKDVTTI